MSLFGKVVIGFKSIGSNQGIMFITNRKKHFLWLNFNYKWHLQLKFNITTNDKLRMTLVTNDRWNIFFCRIWVGQFYTCIQGWVLWFTLAITLVITMHTNNLFTYGNLKTWHVTSFRLFEIFWQIFFSNHPIKQLGLNSLRSTKILSHCHSFCIPLHSLIWPCKDTKWMRLMESRIVVV
jgi:hypothetical protein